jgi:hydrogenase-4 membrane subunit HyfE
MFSRQLSFASLYYIAFVKASIEPKCENGGCTSELAYTLGTIFMIRLLTTNSGSVVMLLIQYWKLPRLRRLADELGNVRVRVVLNEHLQHVYTV